MLRAMWQVVDWRAAAGRMGLPAVTRGRHVTAVGRFSLVYY
jgi:hypothetical protein